MPTSVVPETMIEGVIIQKDEPSRTYSYNPDTGRIAGMVDGKDAVAQWARHAITCERFKNIVYDSQFGSEIRALLGNRDVTNEYRISEIKRMVRDALSVDSRITGISSLTAIQDGDKLFVLFDMSTIFGTVQIEEAVL